MDYQNREYSNKPRQQAFTLIELMVTISIIGIMASLAIPQYTNWVQAEKVNNAVKLTESLKVYVNNYYQQTQRFPTNNITAGLPMPDKLLSPEVSAIDVQDGVFHISLAESTHKALKNKVISVRPVYVENSPNSPISWICGNAPVPKGMTGAGVNKTNVPYTYLPLQCRDLSGATAKKQVEEQAKKDEEQALAEETNDSPDSVENDVAVESMESSGSNPKKPQVENKEDESTAKLENQEKEGGNNE